MTTTRRAATTDVLDFEARFDPGEEGELVGYAAIFDAPNSFGEVVKRGAFRKTLSEHKRAGTRPAMFWHHDPASPIGVWTEIVEDEHGLKATGRLVMETAKGREAHALLRAGAVDGLSIGFRARADERGPNGVRVLTDIELVEISLVSLPAASKARVTKVRAQDAAAPASMAAFTLAARRAAQTLRGRQ